jgi:hypothetical protein
MDTTDHQCGQESQNTNAIALYVSIPDLKINSNSGPLNENKISIYFLNNSANCGHFLKPLSDRNFNLF